MRKAAALMAALAIVLFGGCGDDGVRKIRLHGGDAPAVTETAGPGLRVAVAAFFSPRETFLFFNGFLDLLAERMGTPVKLVQRRRLEEIDDLLQAGDLDMALLDSGAYAAASGRFPLEILAVPVVGGRTVCYSYIIVPRAGGVETFSGLAGKRFAFSDPLSATGWLWPAVALKRKGTTVKRFFKSAVATWGHDRSIVAVAQRQVDGAAVDSLVWQEMNRARPELVARTRIVSVSPALGMHPLVAPMSVPAGTRRRLRRVLLHMHEDEKGRNVLQKTMIDRFVPGDDAMYGRVRGLMAEAGRGRPGE